MADGLKLSQNLKLPLEAITETMAILGIRGSGKTNTATAYVEELLDAGQQVVIIDPTDAWWGLKSSADGLKPGYQVVVLGGKHQDLPLASTDGKLIADFIVEQGVSVICSLRGFESKNQEMKFVTDLLRRLYFLKGQQDAPTPIALVIDEASRLVPQRVMGEDAACVGAVQQIVRQGRSSGFGVVLIDQRAATVNKDVLAQLEMLVVHRTTGPQDRKALKEWIEAHDTANREKEFLASMASLAQGEAWFWSPGWLDLFKKVQVRQRRTFDSSRTPRAGEVVVTPKKIADVDLATLKAKLGATIEKARQDDPKALRAEIAALKKELAAAAKSGRVIEKPVVDQRAIDRAVAAAVTPYRSAIGATERQLIGLVKAVKDLPDRLEAVAAALVVNGNGNGHSANDVVPVAVAKRAPISVARPKIEAAPRSGESGKIGGTPQRMLNTLRFLETVGTSPASRQAIAGLMGVSWDTGSFRNNISELRTAGFILDAAGGALALTDAGRAQASDEGLPTTLAELHATWRSKLGGTTAKMFDILVDSYPESVERQTIGEMIGIGHDTGSFRNNLSEMRSPGLLVDTSRTAVRASDALFPEGLS
jgi:hypothetical protein